MEPPPAETVCTSTVGRPTGTPAITLSWVVPSRPPTIGATSVDVPPMSRVSTSSKPAEPRDVGGADDAAGRARQHAGGGVGGRELEVDEAAGRRHHQRRRQPRGGGALAQGPQVAGEPRREVRRRDRRGGALVLAEGRQRAVREHDPHAGQRGLQRGADGLLVRGVQVAEEEADGDRLGAGRARPPRRRPRGSSRSSGCSTPCGPQRSRTVKRRSRGTSGSGRRAERS